MWFAVTPAGVGFVDVSKRHFTYDFRVPAPPAEVFEAISAPERFERWFPDLRGVRWVTDPPPAAGSVREVRLRGLAVRERILVYEPGARFVFTVTAISRPLLSRMVEDYRLSPVGDGETRVQWTVAYRPRLLLRPVTPLLRPLFGHLFERSTQALRAHFGAA
ncbi:MAG: SRPBCC family protein [Deltaproteobacteria bacterium]|nr:MAG: SRPBCC family protein [Deltaproteobacteria bacterium]